MWGFHFVVKHVGGVKGIEDTQCGFKLFTREAARATFMNLHIERWAFDVELLWLAQHLQIPIFEVQVCLEGIQTYTGAKKKKNQDYAELKRIPAREQTYLQTKNQTISGYVLNKQTTKIKQAPMCKISN